MSRLTDHAVPPLQALEHSLHPVITFFVLPVFALANAGVQLPTDMVGALMHPVALGVAMGLVLGKPIGVLLSSFLMVRLAGARLGEGVTWRHMTGAGILAGIGFTMSLFVNELAFDVDDLHQAAKLGVLVGSLLAGIIGFIWLARISAKKPRTAIQET